jgi:hypothetical protein
MNFLVNDPKINVYMINFPFVMFYVHMVCYLRDKWIRINNLTKSKRLLLKDENELNYSFEKNLIDELLED